MGSKEAAVFSPIKGLGREEVVPGLSLEELFPFCHEVNKRSPSTGRTHPAHKTAILIITTIKTPKFISTV
jgi:hypothetical protein